MLDIILGCRSHKVNEESLACLSQERLPSPERHAFQTKMCANPRTCRVPDDGVEMSAGCGIAWSHHSLCFMGGVVVEAGMMPLRRHELAS